MKCPECQFENRDEAIFCKECGNSLELTCPNCKRVTEPDSKFCDKCGQKLDVIAEPEPIAPEAERKHITVLFSDLSGYTAMSEQLDPEELKEITSRLFYQISEIIIKYEGLVEKYVGDAVLAIFGAPKAHEDDPIRAIKAALEIHKTVRKASPEIEKRIGQPLTMHSGLNTGLAVTGDVDTQKGTHGVAGKTINVASRFQNLAQADEILVGYETYHCSEGYFEFEKLDSVGIKGRTEPIPVYKVLHPKEKPDKIHRLSGLRADLIGRKAEMSLLADAFERLREGKGSIISICGDAGTGKSRLVEEFKATLDLEKIQWLEAHAYAYAQNIPYFPVIDLLSRAFQVKEEDRSDTVRKKIESQIEQLVVKKEEVTPYIGSLYDLSYPAVDKISPEALKSRLQDSIQDIISAFAQKAPTVFFLEDLHWADPSFVELLRLCLLEIRNPAIVFCVHRPRFSLFTSHQLTSISEIYQEISIQDLSLSEAHDMLESLLNTDTIPNDLKRFVQDKSEGNPFYLEELINSLIDSKTLVRDNGHWKLNKAIDELNISSTATGVISSRLDRLEIEAKRILQEASVIGRAFLYDILRKVTEIKQDIDRSIRGLERLSLIKIRSFEPELEYIFKHALTQEVVYYGLLKKERQVIHERIGLVMEKLFQDRLPEFYETLAFHYTRGLSTEKAIDYLLKSGKKSLNRYAIEEAHQYYKEAFEIIKNISGKDEKVQERLLDVLIKWAEVYHLRGAYSGLIELLEDHKDHAKLLRDRLRLGMFYGWFGYALRSRMRLKEGYKYLNKALKLAEEVERPELIGYVCAWLAITCADLSFFDEAISYGKRAYDMCKVLQADQRLSMLTIDAMGTVHYMKGECKEIDKIGKNLLSKGEKESEIRYNATGHHMVACGHFLSGDYSSATESWEKAIDLFVDPIWYVHAKCLLGLSYFQDGQIAEAQSLFNEVVRHSERFGTEIWGTIAQGLLGAISMIQGNLSRGEKAVNNVMNVFKESGYKYAYCVGWYLLGRIYMEIAQGGGPKSLSFLAKNIGFLIKNLPVANGKVNKYFGKAIEIAKEIEANGILGQVYLDFGLFYKARKRTEKARKYITEAVHIFRQCQAEVYLKRAKEALASLE